MASTTASARKAAEETGLLKPEPDSAKLEAAGATTKPRRTRSAASAAKVKAAEAKQPARKPRTNANLNDLGPTPEANVKRNAARQAPASKQPATREQQDRIAELYNSRAYPTAKHKPPEEFSKVGATRWINLLESYPLKEEHTSGYSGSGGTTTKQAPARKRTRGANSKPQTTNGKAKATKPAAKAQTTPSEPTAAELALARKVVAARDTNGLSWLRIGAKFNLSNADSPKNGASRARRLYRLIKGQDASTGLLPKS
jgi:hypothetical protein